MCLNPIKIKNTNRGCNPRAGLMFMKDTSSEFIEVPCGHCSQCVAAKQNSFVQRIQAESEYNHLFFATLTYDDVHLPKLSIEVPVVSRESEEPVTPLEFTFEEAVNQFEKEDQFEHCETDSDFVADASAKAMESGCAQDSGLDDVEYEEIKFAYADIHHIQLLMKNVRDNNPLGDRCIRYACVSELGKMNGRPHFHVLLLVEKRPEDLDSNGKPIPARCRDMQQKLWQCFFHYWAINVGTRKHPVYEPLFTYQRKWSFGKLYTNFDLHWIDPSLTKDQTSNVAYYVSKYMMKGSTREENRQRFLRLNLSEEEYASVWKVIKCRMTCSKGLGLDARMEFIEREVDDSDIRLCDQASALSSYIDNCDDLPDPDVCADILRTPKRVVRSRVLVPNFDLAEKIRRELTSDVGQAPGPIFISPDGKHRPLSHYYQRFGCIYSAPDAIDIWMNWNPDNDNPAKLKPKDEKDKLEREHVRRIRLADAHSSFDNLSTVDMPEDCISYIW